MQGTLNDTYRTNDDYVRWPPHTRLSPASIGLYAQHTHDGHYDLSTGERKWRDVGPFLSRKGYFLRPRYTVGWTPSWIGTDFNPEYCEDSVILKTFSVIDASRREKAGVVIKRVLSNSNEVRMGRLVSSAQWIRNPRNHAVPIFDIFADAADPEVSYIVLPYLRPFNDPPFDYAEEVMDFIGQTLQGLVFLHEHGIAHRSCDGPHIMMDGAPLFPNGHHPVQRNYSQDLTKELIPLSRIDHPTRYFFISFGRATLFTAGVTPAADSAYKKDVYTLGSVFKEQLYEKYYGLDSLLPLVDAMTLSNQELRSTAEAAMTKLQRINNAKDSTFARTRLRPRNETVQERIVRETVAAAKDGMSSLRRLVGQ